MNVLDVVKAVIGLTKSERRQLSAIFRTDCPDEWREAERAYLAEQPAQTITMRKPT